jgi:hypothetical protein
MPRETRETNRKRAGKPEHGQKRAPNKAARQHSLLLQARDSQRKADQDTPHARSSKLDASADALKERTALQCLQSNENEELIMRR